MITTDLRDIAAKIIALMQAGKLPELQTEINEACRGPACDLDRYPDHKLTVEHVSGLMARLLGVPREHCQEAAIQVILPTTRLRIAVDLINEYHARLQDEQVVDFPREKLAAIGRRLRA
jgi:hypothetical protein